ncbi:MAG: M23 family metallopeptidase [Patescibacteria group bacterium]
MKKKLTLAVATLILALPTAALLAFEALAKEAAQVPQIPSFTLSDQNVKQGGVLIVTFSPYSNGFRIPGTVVRIFGKDFAPNNHNIAYIGIDPETNSGKYKICLVEGYTYWYCTEIEVLDRKFQEVIVRKKKPVLNIPGRTSEIAAINEAYARGNSHHNFADRPYTEPLDTMFKTKKFHRKVFFRNGVSVHRGVDLRASIGTPVKAINTGKVVLAARNFSLEGNMVILDHGSGVFSLYLHLSRIDVREGQMVRSRDVIGLAGNTGKVSPKPSPACSTCGSHLHFAVNMNGANVSNLRSKLVSIDPLEFIKAMNELSK